MIFFLCGLVSVVVVSSSNAAVPLQFGCGLLNDLSQMDHSINIYAVLIYTDNDRTRLKHRFKAQAFKGSR